MERDATPPVFRCDALRPRMIAPAPLWRVLEVAGGKAGAFLQTQLTNDMQALSPARALHAALLTPQAKPVAEVYALAPGDFPARVWLLAPAASAEAALARLERFSLGWPVKMRIVEGLSVVSVQGEEAAEALAGAGLPRPEGAEWLGCAAADGAVVVRMPLVREGFWVVAGGKALAALQARADATGEEMEALRIAAGLPRFGCEWDGKTTPLHANLDLADGVSFTKGCYVGQEVVSRMHWRHAVRRRLWLLRLFGDDPVRPGLGALRSVAEAHGARWGIASLPAAEEDARRALEEERAALVRLCGAPEVPETGPRP